MFPKRKTSSYSHHVFVSRIIAFGLPKHVKFLQNKVLQETHQASDSSRTYSHSYLLHDVVEILKKINDLGTTVILATHDKVAVDSVGRRVVTLEGGQVVRDDATGKYVI